MKPHDKSTGLRWLGWLICLKNQHLVDTLKLEDGSVHRGLRDAHRARLLVDTWRRCATAIFLSAFGSLALCWSLAGYWTTFSQAWEKGTGVFIHLLFILILTSCVFVILKKLSRTGSVGKVGKFLAKEWSVVYRLLKKGHMAEGAVEFLSGENELNTERWMSYLYHSIAGLAKEIIDDEESPGSSKRGYLEQAMNYRLQVGVYFGLAQDTGELRNEAFKVAMGRCNPRYAPDMRLLVKYGQ